MLHPIKTLADAKSLAEQQAAATGEKYAVCDAEDGSLFVVPADMYIDQQLYITDAGCAEYALIGIL